MTDKERYERAMRHDFPKDFAEDDEFTAALLDWSEGNTRHKPNYSNTACRMPKSGGERKMANKQTFSNEDKCDYYRRRVNDSKLSQKQRDYAQKRLEALCSGKKLAPAKLSSSSYTSEERAAYGAGVAYGAAKSGARVSVKDENKDSFRKGVMRGKQMGKKPRVGF